MDTLNEILKYLETVEKDIKFIEEKIKNDPKNVTQYEEQLDSLLGDISSKLIKISNEETTD
jgi:hypothetical protein